MTDTHAVPDQWIIRLPNDERSHLSHFTYLLAISEYRLKNTSLMMWPRPEKSTTPPPGDMVGVVPNYGNRENGPPLPLRRGPFVNQCEFFVARNLTRLLKPGCGPQHVP